MKTVIESLVLASIVLVIGLPILLFRRKTVLSIIKSGNAERIPKGRRDAYAKKGIPTEEYFKQFEKENMNIQLKYPVPWAIGVAIIMFFLFMFINSR